MRHGRRVSEAWSHCNAALNEQHWRAVPQWGVVFFTFHRDKAYVGLARFEIERSDRLKLNVCVRECGQRWGMLCIVQRQLIALVGCSSVCCMPLFFYVERRKCVGHALCEIEGSGKTKNELLFQRPQLALGNNVLQCSANERHWHNVAQYAGLVVCVSWYTPPAAFLY